MCLHGVITNSSESVDNILSHYHELWRIKESFRIQRHDLKVRPVFHWNESCVRAHLAICFMAFCCVRYLEYRVRLQYQPLSPKVIRRELSHVQVSRRVSLAVLLAFTKFKADKIAFLAQVNCHGPVPIMFPAGPSLTPLLVTAMNYPWA